MNWSRKQLASMSDAELREGAVELCERGLLTCTNGKPGEDGATYAVAWLPLNNPEQYKKEVRERHNQNMKKFS